MFAIASILDLKMSLVSVSGSLTLNRVPISSISKRRALCAAVSFLKVARAMIRSFDFSTSRRLHLYTDYTHYDIVEE